MTLIQSAQAQPECPRITRIDANDTDDSGRKGRLVHERLVRSLEVWFSFAWLRVIRGRSRFYFSAVLLAIGGFASAGLAQPADADLQERLRSEISSRGVTIVHLWAPWCGNCKAEMGENGWAKFVREHPDVRIVFVNIWHKGQDGAPKLKAAGLGEQKNFVSLTHSNPSNQRGTRLDRFLDMPISWVPTTWIYRGGEMRYALNYGEIRFELLDQMVKDTAKDW